METTDQCIERRTKEIHEYVRHTMQLFIAWYTFFVTANVATVNWISKPFSPTEQPSYTILVIAIVYSVVNIFAIFAARAVRQYVKAQWDEVQSLETSNADLGSLSRNNSMPIGLYEKCVNLIVWTLVCLLGTWLVLPIVILH